MFSTLLKDLRAKQGITQGQLAKAAGVSPGNVGDWETGKSKPGYNALAALTRIFDVSADYLLEIEDCPKKSKHSNAPILMYGDNPLSQMEIDIIAMLRLLNEHDRKIAVDFIAMLYEQIAGEKESIYSTYTSAEGGPGENDGQLSSEASSGTA